MTCPRCQGLVVNDADDIRCLNCGHRPCGYLLPTIIHMEKAREGQAYKDSPTMILRRKLRKARRAHA